VTTSTSPEHVSAVVVDRTDGGITAPYIYVARPQLNSTRVLVAPAYVGICRWNLEEMGAQCRTPSRSPTRPSWATNRPEKS
jgi:hypothetical protein